MTYASATRRPHPAALAGALGVPGAFGALLVFGLAVSVVTAPPGIRLTGETVTETKLPPPPPEPEPEPEPQATPSAAPAAVIPVAPPRPALPPLVVFPIGDTLPLATGTGPGTGIGAGPFTVVLPTPSPSTSLFDPVGARPRSNPARWVTNDDYRPRWILEEMAGTAHFTLAIDASGKVTGCSVTRSTGHAPLDAATCDLVSQRARFEAARDATGKPSSGSYSGIITWKIPR